ncbi:neuropilin and tolloid-like protein 2 [Lingula anatina]|uniref:Neuropilin and tolloid-like protein 2 n=1 Tax=Lingula anatina TaxID=7574 RepID=A0A1S3KA31_LINAN|nr:neuropilin and tolloid-like protein 2 [Lingula anatina]|eukprot:XP_013419485.1 neuropilin and tolloid-like protein 2 [Lingula anatina]
MDNWTGNRWKILIFTMSAMGVLSIGGHYKLHEASRCFNSYGVPKIDLSKCSQLDMIMITKAIQGISRQPNQCEYQEGDCTDVISTDTDAKLQECVGKSTCSTTVTVSWMQWCSAYSTYNYVQYGCIPVKDTLDMCIRGGVHSTLTGFIKSPNYPNNYGPVTDCTCNITTKPDAKLLLTFVDALIEWSKDCQRDFIRIYDGHHNIVRCGSLHRNFNYTTKFGSVLVRFVADGQQEGKGFWMNFKSPQPVTVQCSPTNYIPTTEPPSTTTTVNMNTEKEDKNTEKLAEKENTHTLPDANNEPSIAGIIIACVISLAFLVVLTVLLIRFKRKRHKEKISKSPSSESNSSQVPGRIRGSQHSRPLPDPPVSPTSSDKNGTFEKIEEKSEKSTNCTEDVKQDSQEDSGIKENPI